MRYLGWRRLSGDTARRPDLLDVGKKLLGRLQARRDRGAPRTLVERVLMADGALVEAGFTGEHPWINVIDAPGGGGPPRRYRLYLAVLEHFQQTENQNGGFTLYSMEDYELIAPGQLRRIGELYEQAYQSPSLVIDPQALAVRRDGKRLYFGEYSQNPGAPGYIFDLTKPRAAVLQDTFTYVDNANNFKAAYGGRDLYVAGINGGLIGFSEGGQRVSMLPSGYVVGTSIVCATRNGNQVLVGAEGNNGNHLLLVLSGAGIAGSIPFDARTYDEAAIGPRDEVLYAAGLGKLTPFRIQKDPATGLVVGAVADGGAFIQYPGFLPGSYRFSQPVLSLDGIKLYVSYWHPGVPGRPYFWEFDTATLPAVGNLTDTVGHFIPRPGVRQISLFGYSDILVIGISADGERVFLMTRTDLSIDLGVYAIAVYELESGRVLHEIPLTLSPSWPASTFLRELPPA